MTTQYNILWLHHLTIIVVSFLIYILGFALGSTIQSKTKGIWIWAQNHPRMSDRYLILLDTEGLGDAEKVRKPCQLFSIAI